LNGSVQWIATRVHVAIRGVIMRAKAITVIVILAISGAVAFAMRGENRADAASGNCYASAQGPSAPTICE
jgi:uncharacterized membrane protein